jgi:hypothetical protein
MPAAVFLVRRRGGAAAERLVVSESSECDAVLEDAGVTAREDAWPEDRKGAECRGGGERD